jgi:hypothetical protein
MAQVIRTPLYNISNIGRTPSLELSIDTQNRIIGAYLSGTSYKVIANTLYLHKSLIAYTIQTALKRS